MRTAAAHTYAETNYANSHAPTGYFNGTATTTYAYDHTIARMAQMTPTTTTHYPTKFYSIEYQGVSTTTATSTSYIFHGDTLIAYIEQPLADGVATGTPTTYYVHPDHLGSTNVVTNASGTVVEALDYYPYGSERIHSGSADADRTFIGQFGDDATELSYLNARYYDPARGQFLSQDPTFLAIGNMNELRRLTRQEQSIVLSEPQALNSYAYAKENPLLYKDAEGLWALKLGVQGTVPGWGLSGSAGVYADLRSEWDRLLLRSGTCSRRRRKRRCADHDCELAAHVLGLHICVCRGWRSCGR
jgi:RHS repeat-associated protein